MLTLSWVKCEGGLWCPFQTVDVSNVTTSGVYVIWHGGDKLRAVRIGQGSIADRIKAHRNDSAITAYSSLGLYVTWAAASAAQQNGVENDRADLLQPRVGERFPGTWFRFL